MTKYPHWVAGVLACSLLAVTGCAAPQAAVRGQSAHTTQIGQSRNGNLTTVQDAFHDHNSQHVSYHSTTGFPGYESSAGGPCDAGTCPSGACPTGYGAAGYGVAGYGPGCPPGMCPPGAGGYGACPPGMCPPGACGDGCGQGCPHHNHSYSYSRPNDLVYPQTTDGRQMPGGAVVYPYYTHRGPSDFFRKDGNLCQCGR